MLTVWLCGGTLPEGCCGCPGFLNICFGISNSGTGIACVGAKGNAIFFPGVGVA